MARFYGCRNLYGLYLKRHLVFGIKKNGHLLVYDFINKKVVNRSYSKTELHRKVSKTNCTFCHKNANG